MKRLLFGFLVGVFTGAGGYWYLQQDEGKAKLEQAKAEVASGAEKVVTSIQDSLQDISVEAIKEELAKTSMIVREKAQAAGASIAGATANTRITASIKSKLLANPELSGLGINVNTTDGLVTLSGKAKSHEQIAEAVKIAYDTEGVTKVISTIQPEPAQ
jgi:osmotically-inducible protein OsmY